MNIMKLECFSYCRKNRVFSFWYLSRKKDSVRDSKVDVPDHKQECWNGTR